MWQISRDGSRHLRCGHDQAYGLWAGTSTRRPTLRYKRGGSVESSSMRSRSSLRALGRDTYDAVYEESAAAARDQLNFLKFWATCKAVLVSDFFISICSSRCREPVFLSLVDGTERAVGPMRVFLLCAAPLASCHESRAFYSMFSSQSSLALLCSFFSSSAS